MFYFFTMNLYCLFDNIDDMIDLIFMGFLLGYFSCNAIFGLVMVPRREKVRSARFLITV